MLTRLSHAEAGIAAFRDVEQARALRSRPASLTEGVVYARPAKVLAVVVARDRPEDLKRTVAALRGQSAEGELSILIVDSSQNMAASSTLARSEDTQVIHSQVNLGGAGGFALGLLNAVASGAEWIWLMDDDGTPADEAVLQTLLATAAERGLDAVAPMVLDIENPERFAFPYPLEGRYVFERAALAKDTFLPGMAHLFNGLLIRAQAVFKTGLPDIRMFIRGDEIDFLHRMRRAGLKFGTTTSAGFFHPSSNGELFPVFGGMLHVVYPEPRWKRRNQYRNRGYNFLRHGMFAVLAVDFIRYPYFFLVRRGLDWAGLAEWLQCTWAGLRGDVHVEPVIDLAPRQKEASAR